ncbi:YsnF/AvaK domain-containing protein [Anditalea andensis]|nr:YsnF/AvaK domain-containing protein [Anditalea andensis]
MKDKINKDESLKSPHINNIPIIEEKLHLNKNKIITGSYKFIKSVAEEAVKENLSVTEDNITIQRKEFNAYVDTAPPPVRQEGDSTIISVIKEVLVIEKKMMLVEEIHITKEKKETSISIEDTLRKESIEIKHSNIE